MGSESLGGGNTPQQEKVKELSEPEQELKALTTQQEQLALVMESLAVERSSVVSGHLDRKKAETTAQEVSDSAIQSSFETGEISQDDHTKILNSEDRVIEARKWEEGMESNRTVQTSPEDGTLLDGPFAEKLAALGIDVNTVNGPRAKDGVGEGSVRDALRNRDQELTMQIRAKTLEVPGGKQKLVAEMLKGQNGPMGGYASGERASLLKRAKTEGGSVTVAELYASTKMDRTYPVEARKEALGFIARSTIRDMGGSPDSGESLARALGEYAEADSAVHDKPYLEGESSFTRMEQERTLERAREQSKLLEELSGTMNSIGEHEVLVSSFPGALPSFFSAKTEEFLAATDDGYNNKSKYGFPKEMKELFVDKERLTGAEVAERLKPLIESVQQELQGAETAQEEREEAERKIEELGSRKVEQDLTVT